MRTPPSAMVPLIPEHVIYLAERPLPAEVEQWEHIYGRPYDVDDVLDYLAERQGPCFTVMHRGVPIAAGGFFYVDAGVWQSWMLGTVEGWRDNWRTLSKCARWLADAMFSAGGATRLETIVQPSREDACAWYVRVLGMHRETDSLYVRMQ